MSTSLDTSSSCCHPLYFLFSTLPMVGLILLFWKFELSLYLYMTAPFSIINLIGLGMFESTAIQFGMDQMLEAPSEQFSTFIHWYYWSSVWGQPLIVYIYKGVLFYFSQCKYQVDESTDQYTFKHVHHVYEKFLAIITFSLLAVLQFVWSKYQYYTIVMGQETLGYHSGM